MASEATHRDVIGAVTLEVCHVTSRSIWKTVGRVRADAACAPPLQGLRADSSSPASGPHDEGSLRSRVTPLRAVLALIGVASFAPLLVGVVAQTPGPCDPPNGNHINVRTSNQAIPRASGTSRGPGPTAFRAMRRTSASIKVRPYRFKIDSTNATAYRIDIYRLGILRRRWGSQGRHRFPDGAAAAATTRMSHRPVHRLD